MNAPPPIPDDCGSTSASTICVAIAASIAVPPAFSMSKPACVASGFAAAIMKCCEVQPGLSVQPDDSSGAWKPGSGTAAPEAAATGTTAPDGGVDGDVQPALNATSATAASSVQERECGRIRSNIEPSAAVNSKEATVPAQRGCPPRRAIVAACPAACHPTGNPDASRRARPGRSFRPVRG